MRTGKAQGFALIDVVFVCGIMGLLCSITLPRLFAARQSAGAASAIGSLRAINSSQLTYALTCGGGFYSPNLPTLGVAPPGSTEPFLTPALTAGTSVIKSTYLVTVGGTAFPGAPPTCNGLAAGASAQGFRSGADPTDTSGTRFFGSNSNNVIYENTSSLFASMPETGVPTVGQPLH